MTTPQETLHFLDYWRIIRARKEIVLAVFLLVVITGIVFTLAMPKVYQATCVVQVKEKQPDVPVFERSRMQFDPLFLRTQFEIIQSAPVIEAVVTRQGLVGKLGEAYGLNTLPPDKAFDKAVKVVNRALRVQHYRDTNLIQIDINYHEPKGQAQVEAAATANLIAEVYREQSLARTRRVTEGALDALKVALDEQKRKVVEASAKVEDIRQKYKITVFSSKVGTESVIEKRGLTRLEDERVRVRMELEDKRARYEKVMSLSAVELGDAAPYLVGDPALASLVKAKREAEVRLSEMTMASLGPNHPEVRSAKAVVAELETMITDALTGLKTGMKHDYEAAKAKLDALEVMLEEQKATEISAEASGYREFDKALEEMEHARSIRDALEMRYLEEEIELDIPSTTVEIISPAKVAEPDDFVSPNVMLNIVMSVLMGLCAGIGLAYFVEYIDTSVKTIDDVERLMELPVVGVIPQKVEAFTESRAYREHAEAYRMMRTNVRFSERVKNGRTFCVTSGSMAEGKSLTVFNLGFICAQLGDRVLIVDSDLHRPRQHRILGIPNTPGLANILVGEVQFEQAVVHTKVANLDFLPSGKLASGVHGLLDTSKMRELVQDLSGRYDLVIFDAPPIIGVSDASLLVREVDGVLLVIQHRKYPRTVSMRAKAMVENAGGKLVGVVLNKINISRDYSYYYHYSYYYYHPKRNADEAPKKT
ncbi:MAG: polysaccharide biosynthesis tyrosine autokinase [Lentisphaerae bacterium]|nr:polysaccharide biosynthesis tyrosine autokinase [Lentisphaerota bacterium]